MTVAIPAANTDHGLRGDYSRVRDDYTLDQDMGAYGEADHGTWRTLYRRQMALMPGYAADAFTGAVRAMGVADGIPDLARVSGWLSARTGWTLVAVPGLIPDGAFFDHLANRRFPVTWWIRTPEEMDYLVEPDIFHDFFGHVPMLATPVFADYLAAYGAKGVQAEAEGGLKMLARLYWYMVEFGLVRTPAGLRAYGAGILSSKGETVHCLDSPEPNRIGFDLARVMRTDYKIDTYQRTYFVLDSFDQLFAATDRDFTPLYRAFKDTAPLAPDAVLPEDRVLHRGRPPHAAA